MTKFPKIKEAIWQERGIKVDPDREFKNFMQSIEEFLHRGQYPSLTILMEGILNYLMQK